MKQSSVESEISSFIGKYEPQIAARLRGARAKLHSLFPRGHELVYDNYNALVFGFSPSERTSDALLSIAGYPKWVTLIFLRGAILGDPHKLLQGSGSQVRSIRLAAVECLDRPEVISLIEQAVQPHAAAFGAAPVRSTVVKSVSSKQRPRRPGAPRGGR